MWLENIENYESFTKHVCCCTVRENFSHLSSNLLGSSVGRVKWLQNWVIGLILGMANFLLRIDGSHGNRIHLSLTTVYLGLPHPGGSVVSVSDWWPGSWEFDPRLRRLFFSAYFHLSPLQKHVRKVVGGFGKKSFVSTGVRKPGNTNASPTAIIWP